MDTGRKGKTSLRYDILQLKFIAFIFIEAGCLFMAVRNHSSLTCLSHPTCSITRSGTGLRVFNSVISNLLYEIFRPEALPSFK